jgi:hypothetical protein
VEIEDLMKAVILNFAELFNVYIFTIRRYFASVCEMTIHACQT